MISVPSPGLGTDSLIVGESAFGANNAFSISAFSSEHPHLMALSSQAERDYVEEDGCCEADGFVIL